MATAPATGQSAVDASAEDPRDAGLPDRVVATLAAYLTGRRREAAEVDAAFAGAVDTLADFALRGGKRIRPTFAWWGWRGAGGDPGSNAAPAVLQAVSALELVHACALIHDDVMDGSTTRRGEPTVHVEFAEAHRAAGWLGPAGSFGVAAAMLLGDLALAWADDMLHSAGLDPAAAVRAAPHWRAMRTEVLGGQYLDVLHQATGDSSPEAALRVCRYKTAAYTVQRPLHLGAALADAPAPQLAAHEPSEPTSASRSSCGTTCSASSATRRSPENRPATTSGGQAHVPDRARPAARRAHRCRRVGPRRHRRAWRGRAGRGGNRPGAGRAGRAGRRRRGRATDRPAGGNRACPAGRRRADRGGRAAARGTGRRRHPAIRLDDRVGQQPPTGRLEMRTVPGRTDHVVVVGAGLAGLSAALHLLGAGRRVTILERDEHPGGRAGRLDLHTASGRYQVDTGPTVLTMPGLLEEALDAVGEQLRDRLDLVALDPAYRARFADGSTIDVHTDAEAMEAEIRPVCGPRRRGRLPTAARVADQAVPHRDRHASSARTSTPRWTCSAPTWPGSPRSAGSAGSARGSPGCCRTSGCSGSSPSRRCTPGWRRSTRWPPTA